MGTGSWGGVSFDRSDTFVNDRVLKPGWAFDADGRNTVSTDDNGVAAVTTYDAAGRGVRKSATGEADSRSFYDAGGFEIKRMAAVGSTIEPTKYFIRSSVLKGRVVSEVWANGKKHRTYVQGIGKQTAVQTAYAAETAAAPTETVMFEYSDALGLSYRTTDKLGAPVAYGDGGEGSPIETDPLGGSVGTSTPYFQPIVYQPEPQYPDLEVFSRVDDQVAMMDFGALYSFFGSRVADLPGFGTRWGNFADFEMAQYDERVHNAFLGLGFQTNEQLTAALTALGHNIYIPNGVRLTGFGVTVNDDVRGGNWSLDQAIANSEGVGALFANWDESDFLEDDNFYIIGIWGDRKKKVLDILEYATSGASGEACAKAFSDAGLTPITTQILEGLTILSQGIATNPADDAQWAPKKEFAQAMRGMWAAYPTTNDVTQHGDYLGRRYIALANRAFSETDDHLSVSVIHSLIHSGSINGSGERRTTYFTGKYTDAIYNGKTGMETTPARPINAQATRGDLEWMGAKYNAIIAACTREGSSRVGPARGQ